MSPTRTIQGENPITEQRIKLLMSGPQTKILKLRRKDSLDILRLNSRNQLARQKPLLEGVAVDTELIREIIDPSLFADGLGETVEGWDSQKSRCAMWWFLAMQGFGLFIVMV